jgi:hypothetical protein
MDTFGKTVWIALVAGAALLPLGGCTKTPGEQFAAYDQLKKPSGGLASDAARPLEANAEKPKVTTPSAAKPDALTRLTSIPSSAPVAANPIAPAKLSSAPGPPVAPTPVAGSQRKVQVLIPFRDFKTEGQDGAIRVSYDDIDLLKVLNMDPVTPDAATKMPPWLKNLEGRRIRIRGFMYPTFQQTGVHAFGLARDNQICCFGRNPKIYDVFDVLLRDGVTTNYLPNRPFDVVGVFHIRPEADNGKLFRLYEMDDATVVIK